MGTASDVGLAQACSQAVDGGAGGGGHHRHRVCVCLLFWSAAETEIIRPLIVAKVHL